MGILFSCSEGTQVLAAIAESKQEACQSVRKMWVCLVLLVIFSSVDVSSTNFWFALNKCCHHLQEKGETLVLSEGLSVSIWVTSWWPKTKHVLEKEPYNQNDGWNLDSNHTEFQIPGIIQPHSWFLVIPCLACPQPFCCLNWGRKRLMWEYCNEAYMEKHS